MSEIFTKTVGNHLGLLHLAVLRLRLGLLHLDRLGSEDGLH
jgi:hypothetical protein